MFQNKGFTLIEMMFVLSIMVSMTLLTIPYYFHHQVKEDWNQVESQISMIIDQAKQQALYNHQKVDLVFDNQEVYYFKGNQKVKLQLPKEYHFEKIKEIYFNKNGNINQANHIILANDEKRIKLVFHLGAGEYEFQS